MTVGTPPIDVTCSRSMISIATSGSKRPGGISTTLAPGRVARASSSTGSRSRGTAARRAATPSGARLRARAAACRASPAATPSTMMFCRFAITWRCVSVAPLGLPGRARRVEDREEVVLVERRLGEHRRVAVGELGERAAPAPSGASVVDHEDVLERRDARQTGRAIIAEAARVGDRAPWPRSRRARTRAPRPSTTRSAARRRRRAPRTPRTSRPTRDCWPTRARPGRRADAELGQRRRDHARARRSCSPKVQRAASPCTTKSTSARAALCAISSRSDVMRCL